MPQVRAEPRFPLDPSLEQEWPEASALATACFLNMGYLASRVQAYVEALVRRHGLPSMSAFNVLTILHGAGEPLLPSTIAERMVVTRGTMTIAPPRFGSVSTNRRPKRSSTVACPTQSALRLAFGSSMGIPRMAGSWWAAAQATRAQASSSGARGTVQT